MISEEILWLEKLEKYMLVTTQVQSKHWSHLCYIHSSCRYSPLNKIICFVLVNSTQVFLERILLQRILLLVHEKLIGRDAIFILMKFEMDNSIQTENIQLSHVQQNFRYKMLFCMFKFCLISNYSNSVVLLRILLLQIYLVCGTA